MTGFLGELETLLAEETLVGRGRLCQAELRPLAYSMLAELVHHIRADLSAPQLSRIVYLFCRRAPPPPAPLPAVDRACAPAPYVSPPCCEHCNAPSLGLPLKLATMIPVEQGLARHRRRSVVLLLLTCALACRRNIHDSSLPVSVQCTSVRLLLNLVEVTFSRRADLRVAETYRGLLDHILDAFTAKLGSLHRRLPSLLEHGARALRLALAFHQPCAFLPRMLVKSWAAEAPFSSPLVLP